MRVLTVVGVAVLVVAAWVVPLPWAVVRPAELVTAAEVVTVDIDADYLAAAGGRDTAVSGTYLVTAEHERVPLIRLVTAAAAPGHHVVRPRRRPTGEDTLVAATMAGLGVAPRHADPSEVPVTVRLTGPAAPDRLGLSLYAFDLGATVDLARGRRVLALGTVDARGLLQCASPIAETVRSAAEAGVDVVVVPTPCAGNARDAVPAGSSLQVLDAAQLIEAADALAR